MIKANELRIGNWVLDYGVKRKVTGIVTSAIFYHVFLDDSVTYRSLKNVDPIVLSVELLQKCEFENNCGWWSHKDWAGFEILQHWLDDFDVFHLTYDKTIISPPIHFHHLQNLYFFHKGNELSINL